MSKYKNKKESNPLLTVLYIIVFLALCACIAGLWMRQTEKQENYQEMVRQAAEVETEYQLQRYGSDETEESVKETATQPGVKTE